MIVFGRDLGKRLGSPQPCSVASFGGSLRPASATAHEPSAARDALNPDGATTHPANVPPYRSEPESRHGAL
jgi:hypothetical protein